MKINSRPSSPKAHSRKPILTPQERERLLDQFQASGLSVSAFARKHSLNYSTVQNWLSRRAKAPDRSPRPKENGVVEVQIPPWLREPPLVLQWKNTVRLEIHSPNEAEWAGRLVEFLKEGGC